MINVIFVFIQYLKAKIILVSKVNDLSKAHTKLQVNSVKNSMFRFCKKFLIPGWNKKLFVKPICKSFVQKYFYDH